MKIDSIVREFSKHDIGGHEFGYTRGLQAFAFIFGGQYLSAVVIHDVKGFCIDGGRRRDRRRGQDGHALQEQSQINQCQSDQYHAELFNLSACI